MAGKELSFPSADIPFRFPGHTLCIHILRHTLFLVFAFQFLSFWKYYECSPAEQWTLIRGLCYSRQGQLPWQLGGAVCEGGSMAMSSLHAVYWHGCLRLISRVAIMALALEVSAMMIAVGRDGMSRFGPWEKFTSTYVKTDQWIMELVLSTGLSFGNRLSLPFLLTIIIHLFK